MVEFIAFWICALIISLGVLVKSADWFIGAAEKIGLHFGLPSFIVGITIASVGTSLPELLTAIIAAFTSPEIVTGTAIGSNISNILLVVGIGAIAARHLRLTWELIHVDLPMLVGSAFLLYFAAMDGTISVFEALIFLAIYLVYIEYTLSLQKKNVESQDKEGKVRPPLEKKTILALLASMVLLYIGANYTVESVINLSGLLGIGMEIIALSAVAIGTSLPELTVSIMAAKKANFELAVGNVFGSNIFNTFVVIGIPALLVPLAVPASIIALALPFMVVITLLAFFITQDKDVTRWEGALLVLLYVFFLGTLLGLT